MAIREKPAERLRALSDAGWMPVGELVPIDEREERPDRFAELLECMADLRVEICRQQAEMARYRGSRDPRVRTAIARLSELEHSLGEVGAEAASVHQLLQHVRLM